MAYVTDTRSPLVISRIFSGIEIMSTETGVPVALFPRFVSCHYRLQCFSKLGAEFGGLTGLLQYIQGFWNFTPFQLSFTEVSRNYNAFIVRNK